MTPRISRLLRLATYASVATAVLLGLSKLVAWLLTGAISVLASFVDSLMDAGASVINLLAVHYSLMPADDKHRFGHGKAEALAGLAQATFIAGSALFLLLHAVDRLVHPRPVAQVGVGLGVLLFAIAATLALLAIQRRVIRETQSTAIRADALHYATDLATNSAAIAGLLLAHLGWPGLDPLFALAIGVYILYSAYRIGRDAVELLMDRELPEQERARITAIAEGTPGVLGAHGLRTRQSGQTKVIQLHLELPDALPLVEAHRITSIAEARLHEAFAGADVIIHQDPTSVGDEGEEPARAAPDPEPASG